VDDVKPHGNLEHAGLADTGYGSDRAAGPVVVPSLAPTPGAGPPRPRLPAGLYLAPAINIGSQDYQELRAAERNILAGFLGNVRVRTLASDSFGWADEIPHLIQASDLDRMTALDPSLVPGNGKPGSCTGGEEPAVDAWLRWSDRLAYGRLA
jgi:hypothetical protein